MPSKKPRKPNPDALAKAIASPIRRQILEILCRRVSSPSRVAKDLKKPAGTLNYHFGVLLESGAIELVREVPARGSTEHFYIPRFEAVAAICAVNGWAGICESIQEHLLTAATASSFTSELFNALGAGTFDRHQGAKLQWVPLLVDEQGWDEATNIIDTALQQLYKLHEASREHLKKSGDEETPIVAGLAIFKAGPVDEIE